MKPLAGQVAVVTGASRGIGAAVAAAFAQAGAVRVVRLARSLSEGESGAFRDLPCDVTDPVQVLRAAERVLRESGPPDVVINNAGSFLLRPFEGTGIEEFEAQIAVNLRAPFAVARAFLPAMRRAGRGLHVSVGSVADHRAFPENAAYAASKFGLRGLHETLAAEYQGTGVRLALVSPGPTDTAAWDPVDPDNRPGVPNRAAMLRATDVAEAILFLATRPPTVTVDWLRLGPT